MNLINWNYLSELLIIILEKFTVSNEQYASRDDGYNLIMTDSLLFLRRWLLYEESMKFHELAENSNAAAIYYNETKSLACIYSWWLIDVSILLEII